MAVIAVAAASFILTRDSDETTPAVAVTSPASTTTLVPRAAFEQAIDTSLNGDMNNMADTAQAMCQVLLTAGQEIDAAGIREIVIGAFYEKFEQPAAGAVVLRAAGRYLCPSMSAVIEQFIVDHG